MLYAILVSTPMSETLAEPVLPTVVPAEHLTEDPYRHVGLVRTDSIGMDPTVLGSGWVAGERIVASAAHVFFVEENLGWNRNRWYWKRAAYSGQFWNTNEMIRPRGYRVLAGYAEAAKRETNSEEYFMDARNRDAVALMFYRAVSNSPPPPRATNALEGTGTFSIVGYPAILAGIRRQEIEMHAHLGGHMATFAANDDVTSWGGWPNTMFETQDISSGQGGSGGPVFRLVSGEWTVVGSFLAIINKVAGFCRSIDDEFEEMLTTAISDSTVTGPGEVIWELEVGSKTDPVIRSDGSIVFVAQDNNVVAVDSKGVELWSRSIGDWSNLWMGEAPDGRVLVGTSHDIAALDGTTGKILWRLGTGIVFGRGAVGEVGQTYVSSDLALARISPSGTLDWKITLPYENLYTLNENAPAIGPDGTVFVVSQTRVYAVNPADGSIRWRSEPIPGILGTSLCAGLDGSVTLSRSGGATRLEADGSIRWKFDEPIGAGRIHVRGDGSVVIVKDDAYGLIILRPDGTTERTINMAYGVQSATEDDSGHLYVGTSAGVMAFDSDWNQMWRNEDVVGTLFIGRLNFLIGIGTGTFVPSGIRSLGTFSGGAPDLWQAGIGGADGARRAANSQPQPPTIVVPPDSTRVIVGYRLELFTIAEGSFPMTFEWRRNGELLADQVGQRLVIQKTTDADAGEYTVTVRNTAGEVTSNPVTVVIGTPRFGDRLWATNLISVPAAALGDDGTVYAFVEEPIGGPTSYENHLLVAVDAQGNEKWRQNLGTEWYSSSGRSPVVGDDGRIYATNPGRIWAFDPSGVLLWKVDTPSTVGNDTPLVVLARDNGVFFRNHSYLGNISPDGTVRWQRTDIDARGMEVRRDGRLVIGAGEVISQDGVRQVLNPNTWGSTNFSFIGPGDEWVMTTHEGGITLGSDGTVVALNPESIYDLPLFMLADGTIVTDRMRLEPFMGTGSTYITPPGNGKLIGVLEGDRMLWTHGDGRIAVLDRSGRILAEAEGVNGYEFNVSRDGILIGGNPLAAYNVDWGVSNSPWPLPLADPRNTNRGPVPFDLEVSAPRAVVLRGRLDPLDPLVSSMPFQDRTMQGYVGYGVSLVAHVQGSGPFTFRWSKDGKLLEGGNKGELRFSSPGVSDSGEYTVSVTNEAGTTYSDPFSLVVSPPTAITPGTYVRMWTDPGTSEKWPLMFKVTGDRQIEINLFNLYGVQGKARIFPDGSFYRAGNNHAEFSGYFIGSTLTLNDSAPLTEAPTAITGMAGNGVPAGVYQGHALGRTGLRVVMVVFADGTFSWLQGTGGTFSTSARGLFEGTSRTTTLMVPDTGSSAEYTVTADPTGALVGQVKTPSSQTQSAGLTGFVATWNDRPGVERFANLSTRGFVAPGQPPMVAGFFFEGPTNHSFLLRAAGPALAQYDIQNPLARPRLRLMSPQGSELRRCEAWRLDPGWAEVQTAAARLGAFAFAETDIDSAIHSTLSPGGYTMLVDDVNGAAGITLVEIYEDRATSGDASRLRNLSTRGNVGRGERVLVGGFYVTGTVPKSVLVRASGPSLAQYSQGLFNTASDPRLTIYRADDTEHPIASNDDYWLGGNEPEVRAAASRVGAFEFFAGSKDAALVLALPPGGYTAVVDNVTPEEGVALLEIYEIPSR